MTTPDIAIAIILRNSGANFDVAIRDDAAGPAVIIRVIEKNGRRVTGGNSRAIFSRGLAVRSSTLRAVIDAFVESEAKVKKGETP